MRRQIPLIIVFVVGIFGALSYFIMEPVIQGLRDQLLTWLRLIGAFALGLGIASFLRNHGRKMTRQVPGWGFNAVAIASFLVMAVVGIGAGIEEGTLFRRLFDYAQVPMEATMFSLLAFYIASASFRAFRARSKEATLLLVSAVIVMLGRVLDADWLSGITEWILEIPNGAAQRGIIIGVGMGMIATALKIILGIERSYLGNE
ncbi:MAG: hypothetical protein GF399_10070 [Candidatus Coatesbacteria bacterium]|jgi:hypothetical protein|nr:hypothetical protein [Candidatus Coatesbacteria bacterium]